MSFQYVRPPISRLPEIRASEMSFDRHQSWRRWAWCDADDLLRLINATFKLHWSRRDLIRRFAIQGVPVMNRRFPLSYLRHDEAGFLTWCSYQHNWAHRIFLNQPSNRVYFPGGWAQDVLWALYQGCTSFRLERRALVACMEDGCPIYYV